MKARPTTWTQRQDDDMSHQIRLLWGKDDSGTPAVAVSCNCRETEEGSYDPMGTVGTGASPWPMYNDHENHNPKPELFTEADQGGPHETRTPFERRNKEASN